MQHDPQLEIILQKRMKLPQETRVAVGGAVGVGGVNGWCEAPLSTSAPVYESKNRSLSAASVLNGGAAADLVAQHHK
jgi:hypothetical protein